MAFRCKNRFRHNRRRGNTSDWPLIVNMARRSPQYSRRLFGFDGNDIISNDDEKEEPDCSGDLAMVVSLAKVNAQIEEDFKMAWELANSDQ